MAQIRERWPDVRLIVRGDAGFCREPLMVWCEEQERVDYVFGLAGNQRLAQEVERQQKRAGSRCVTRGEAARRYRSFRYRTLESWSRKRRVVAKAEWLPGLRGRNQRFVVTSMSRKEWKAKALYEKLYCARGDMENRIKEQQLHLFADRTSAGSLRANPLRMYWALFGADLGLLVAVAGGVGIAAEFAVDGGSVALDLGRDGVGRGSLSVQGLDLAALVVPQLVVGLCHGGFPQMIGHP